MVEKNNMKDVTIIIKTFNRKKAVKRLLDSIEKYNPDTKVLVCDDSEEPEELNYKNVKYFITDFDIGLSAGRNFLLDRVKTKYFILMDDDYVVNENTNLELFPKLLEKYNLDILAGIWNDEKIMRHGELKIGKNSLEINKKIMNEDKEIYYCDMTLNFFIAKTEKIKKIKWDENLKLNEHLEFFYRIKKYHNLKIACTPKINILHIQERSDKNYTLYRKRNYFLDALKKHKITFFKNPNGKIIKNYKNI